MIKFVSSICKNSFPSCHGVNVFQSQPNSNTSMKYIDNEVYDIMKAHWQNGVAMRQKFDISTFARQNVVVVATNNNDVDMSLFDLDIDTHTVYFNEVVTHNCNKSTLNDCVYRPCLDMFVCEYSVFMRLTSCWKHFDMVINDILIERNNNSKQYLMNYLQLRLIKTKIGKFIDN